MKIIKLNNKNQYEIIQEIILIGSNYYLDQDFKVIESKNDELIAIFRGNLFKDQLERWKLNKSNKYELCTSIKALDLYGILKLNEEEFVVVQKEEILTTHPYIHE